MSSLRPQSPLEYPQNTVLPTPSAQSGVLYLRKRNRSPWFFSAQAMWSQIDTQFFSAQVPWSQKEATFLPRLGLNPSANRPLTHHLRLLPQLATAASIPVFFQLYRAAIVSPGRCGLVVWSQSSPSSYAGSVTRGSCLPVTSEVEVTPIPLAQSRATAV